MELRGNITDFPLPDIIQLLGAGRKTGMLSITFKKQKASLYLESGNIVHASMLNTKGKDAVAKMFHINEGRFHFYSGVLSEEKTLNVHTTTVLMEALATYDESKEKSGDFDRSGGKKKSHNEKIKDLKNEMIQLVNSLYGNKAKKLEQLIRKCGNSEIELMSSCDKIEKYIYVFLDSQNYKNVTDKIRHLIEETH
ncbi:DUF4388 domain-containing protein [Thermodesulfobacteriota bacterium]